MKYNKPFVGIHHLEAHILMARLPVATDHVSLSNESNSQDFRNLNRSVEFPFLALLVSGGHCLLLKCIGIGRYHMIGGTIDDSLGMYVIVVTRTI